MTAVRPRDLLLLLGITFIWGLNLITSKLGVDEMPPILLTFLRFAIVALALAPWLRIQPGQMSALVVAGLLSGALNLRAQLAALRRASSVSVGRDREPAQRAVRDIVIGCIAGRSGSLASLDGHRAVLRRRRHHGVRPADRRALGTSSGAGGGFRLRRCAWV